MLANGSSNAQIARSLGLSLKTIQNYVSRILDKLQVSDRTQAALRAQRERDLGATEVQRVIAETLLCRDAMASGDGAARSTVKRTANLPGPAPTACTDIRMAVLRSPRAGLHIGFAPVRVCRRASLGQPWHVRPQDRCDLGSARSWSTASARHVVRRESVDENLHAPSAARRTHDRLPVDLGRSNRGRRGRVQDRSRTCPRPPPCRPRGRRVCRSRHQRQRRSL